MPFILRYAGAKIHIPICMHAYRQAAYPYTYTRAHQCIAWIAHLTSRVLLLPPPLQRQQDGLKLEKSCITKITAAGQVQMELARAFDHINYFTDQAGNKVLRFHKISTNKGVKQETVGGWLTKRK